MIRLLIFFLFLSLALTGCKSIKKAKQAESVTLMKSATTVAVDSSVFLLSAIQKEIKQEEVTETTEQTFVPMDSAGLTVFKPVIIQKKISRSTQTIDSTKSESDVRVDSFRERESYDSLSGASNLDKFSEGQDPIESIATAIFPTWGKIIAAILTGVVPIVWAWWKKRKEGSA